MDPFEGFCMHCFNTEGERTEKRWVEERKNNRYIIEFKVDELWYLVMKDKPLVEKSDNLRGKLKIEEVYFHNSNNKEE